MKPPALSFRNRHRIRSAPAPVILFLRYLSALADPAFQKHWERFLSHPYEPAEEAGPRRILLDQSILYPAKSPGAAVRLARELLLFLNRKSGRPVDHPPPIQILIDAGVYLGPMGEKKQGFSVDWSALLPGMIYLTAAAAAQSGENLQTDPPTDSDTPGHVIAKPADGAVPSSVNRPFFFRRNLADGPYRPCFYCGSRRHRVRSCPTKALKTDRCALEQLGYLSPEAVNRLFFRHLMSESGSTGAKAPGSEETLSPGRAMDAFYDLTYVLQLRFLMRIWNGNLHSWDALVQDPPRRSPGGKLRLAIDCLRTGKFTKAETILDAALKEFPHSFKAHCCSGFFHLERADSDHARYHFGRAVHYAESPVRKAFALFLLARLSGLTGDRFGSERYIEDILENIPSCPEAEYLRVRARFQNGRHRAARTRLAELIRAFPLFYCQAYIDPDLAVFAPMVQPVLDTLYTEAAAAAEREAQQAGWELDRCRALLGSRDRSLRELETLWKKMEDLRSARGYLGYLQAAQTAGQIDARARSLLSSRRDRIFNALFQLNERTYDLIASIQNVPARGAFSKLYTRIKDDQVEIEDLRKGVNQEDPEAFRSALNEAARLSDRLSQTETQLAWAYNLWVFRSFLMILVKHMLVLQVFNFLVAFVLFPLLFRFLAADFSPVYFSRPYLKFYQVGFLVIGTVGALLVGIIKGIRHLFPEPSGSGS